MSATVACGIVDESIAMVAAAVAVFFRCCRGVPLFLPSIKPASINSVAAANEYTPARDVETFERGLMCDQPA